MAQLLRRLGAADPAPQQHDALVAALGGCVRPLGPPENEMEVPGE